MKKIIYTLLFALFFISCSNDEDNKTRAQTGKSTPITIRVQNPLSVEYDNFHQKTSSNSNGLVYEYILYLSRGGDVIDNFTDTIYTFDDYFTIDAEILTNYLSFGGVIIAHKLSDDTENSKFIPFRPTNMNFPSSNEPYSFTDSINGFIRSEKLYIGQFSYNGDPGMEIQTPINVKLSRMWSEVYLNVTGWQNYVDYQNEKYPGLIPTGTDSVYLRYNKLKEYYLSTGAPVFDNITEAFSLRQLDTNKTLLISAIAPDAYNLWGRMDINYGFTPDWQWAAGTLVTIDYKAGDRVTISGAISESKAFSIELDESWINEEVPIVK